MSNQSNWRNLKTILRGTGLHVKHLRSVSDKIGGHKRTTGEAGIVTTSVFWELDWDYSGN